MTENQIREYLEDAGYSDTIIYTNPSYVKAFIGVTTDGRAIYDYEQMVTSLVEEDEMTMEEAMEWIDYNCVGFFIENGPIIVNIGNEAYEYKAKESNVIVGNFKKADKTKEGVA